MKDWIKTNEKLPTEEYKQFKKENINLTYYPCLATMHDPNGQAYVDKIYFNGQNFTNGGRIIPKEFILAWMAFPKPYKE